MTAITKFEDIEGWQAARILNEAFNKEVSECRTFTNASLADQMSRSAVSSMANIAEGYEAGSDREFIRFLKIAKRSASEFQSHLYAALDTRQISKKSFDWFYEQARVTKGLIGGFIKYLESSLAAKSRGRGPRTS